MSLDKITADGILAGSINAASLAVNSVPSSRLTTTGVVANSYGNATHIATFTTDAAGRLSVANTVALITSNSTVAGVIQVVDSVTNTSILVAAAANSVKTAFDLATTANSGLATAYSNATTFATTIAGTAYTNAVAQATTLAGTAYSNAVSVAAADATSKAATAYSNAVTQATTLAGTAYSNAVTQATTLAGTAYTNAVAQATSLAATAYSNAVSTAAADATSKAATAYSNAVSTIQAGTTFTGAVIMQANLTANNVRLNGSMQIDGNLTVSGTSVTLNVASLSVGDNMIYLNSNSTVSNPDLGFAGNYNDGTYRHAGFFRDATDGVWKVFHQYLPEPDASAYIDTSNASFALANLQANTFIGAGSFTTVNTSGTTASGNTTITGSANVTTTLQVGGATTLAAPLAVTGSLVANSLGVYANNAGASGSGDVSGMALKVMRNGTVDYTMGSDGTNVYLQSWNSKPLYINNQGNPVVFSTAVSGITTLAAGNTTITGFANVSTTLQVGTNTSTFGTALYVAANGNIGIANANPVEKLNILLASANVYSAFTTQYKTGVNANTVASGIRIVGHSLSSTSANSVAFIGMETRAPALNGAHGTASYITLTHGSGATYGDGQLDFFIRNNTASYTFRGDPEVANTYWMTSLLTLKSDGKVGIGTTTPSYKLEVRATDSALLINTTGATTNLPSIDIVDGAVDTILTSSSSQSGGFVGTYSNHGFGLRTNNATRIFVTANGNTAVKDTVAPYALDVAGDIGIRGANYLYMGHTDTGTNWGTRIRSSSGDLQVNMYSFRFNDVGYTNNIEWLAGTANGNVGVGTTTPGRKLHVYTGSSGATVDTLFTQMVIENSNDAGIHIINPSASIGRIMFGTPARQYGGLIRWDNTNNNFDFSTDKTGGYIRFLTDAFQERMVIAANGNIGIATSSSAVKLDVNGSSTFRDTMNFGPSQGLISWGSMGGGTGFGLLASSGKTLSLGANGNWDSIVIAANGNIGINTVSPLYPLDVQSSGTTPFIRIKATSSSGQASLYIDGFSDGTTHRAARINLMRNASTKWSIIQDYNQNATDTLDFELNGSRKITFDQNGNVGIGISSPTLKLDVRGGGLNLGTSTDGIRLGVVGDNSAYDNVLLAYSGYNSGSPEVTFQPRTTPGSGVLTTFFRFKNSNGGSTSSNNRASVTIEGDVGIGTASPTTKLEVNGGIKFSAGNLTQDNSLLFFTKTGGGADTASANTHFIGRIDTAGYHVTSGAGGFDGIANAFVVAAKGPLILATSNTNSTYSSGRVLITTEGRVAIAATSGSILPALFPAKLGIVASGNEDGIIVKTDPTATNAGSAIFHQSSSNAQFDNVRIQSVATTSGFGILHVLSGSTDGNGADGTSRFYVRGDGNVGIGTANPGALLDVSAAGAGSTVESRLLNTSTSAGSHARQFVYVNSGTAGDPYTIWTVGGVTSWAAGIRNSDSDKWYLSSGSSLASTPTITATTTGLVGIGTQNPQKLLDVHGSSGIFASIGGAFGSGTFGGFHFGYSESVYNNDAYKKSALVFERTDDHGQGGNASGKIHFLLNNVSSQNASDLSHSVVTIDSAANATIGTVRMGVGVRNPQVQHEVLGETRTRGLATTRSNIESQVVSKFSGTSGTASIVAPANTEVGYIKKHFKMDSTTAGALNQTLVTIDSRAYGFHEAWIKITWGTRMQGVSDTVSAVNERAYGINKFNGNTSTYNITSSWSHVDANSDAHADIVVVNGATNGTCIVQYQQSSSVSSSSFIWGYIEICSVETVDSSVITFNC